MSNFTIKPRTKIRKIERNIIGDDREALRKSQQRREQFSKLAVMHTGQRIYVQISGDSAYADIADRSSELGYTDRIIINIRAEIPKQIETNLDEEVWDLMVQKTDFYHELGHIKWTDWPSYEEVLFGDGNGNYGITEEHHQMFSNWTDLVEDAAIERLLVDQFDIENELRVVNENLIKNNPPDKTVSLNAALGLKLIEYKHPVGWIDVLMDESNDDIQFLTDEERTTFEEEILPEVEGRVPDIIDEPDPEKRNYMMFDLYSAIGIYFDDSVKPGTDEKHAFNFPEDHEDFGAGQQGNPPNQGNMPDIDITGGDSSAVDVDKQQDYSNQIDQQKQQLGQGAKKDSFEEWTRIIDQEYEKGTTMQLEVPSNPPDLGSYNDATRQEAERLSKPLAKHLGQRLQMEQRTQKQKKKKSGSPDPKRLHKTSQGDTNVFQSTNDPDDKDYSCIITLDRSGSMSQEMEEAEAATGALAFALEEIGVEVAIISFSSGDIYLEKDFAETVEEAKKKIFRGYNSGGTPLSDALALSRARFQNADDNPFMIAITDGEPDHRERYRDQLHQCDFPVLGVYMEDSGSFDEEHMNEAGYFHQLELREADKVFDGLRNLVKRVMF